jgi:hypothetical protein
MGLIAPGLRGDCCCSAEAQPLQDQEVAFSGDLEASSPWLESQQGVEVPLYPFNLLLFLLLSFLFLYLIFSLFSFIMLFSPCLLSFLTS